MQGPTCSKKELQVSGRVFERIILTLEILVEDIRRSPSIDSAETIVGRTWQIPPDCYQ